MGTYYEDAKAMRIAERLSQRDLGKKLNLSQSTINLFEKGGKVNSETIDKILKYFSIEKSELTNTQSALSRKNTLYRQIGFEVKIYISLNQLSLEEFNILLGGNHTSSIVASMTIGNFEWDYQERKYDIFSEIKNIDKKLYERIIKMLRKKEIEKYSNIFLITEEEKKNINDNINNIIINSKINKENTKVYRVLYKIKHDKINWLETDFGKKVYNSRKTFLELIKKEDKKAYNKIISMIPFYMDNYFDIPIEEIYGYKESNIIENNEIIENPFIIKKEDDISNKYKEEENPALENTGWMDRMNKAFENKNTKDNIEELVDENLAEEDRIAKENLDLLRFDYIHNKIMGFIVKNRTISEKEYKILKKEISLCDFDTYILEIKLNNIRIRKCEEK